jgi:hypothetical protein
MNEQVEELEKIIEYNQTDCKVIDERIYKMDGILVRGVQTYLPIIFETPNSSVLNTTVHTTILSMNEFSECESNGILEEIVNEKNAKRNSDIKKEMPS